MKKSIILLGIIVFSTIAFTSCEKETISEGPIWPRETEAGPILPITDPHKAGPIESELFKKNDTITPEDPVSERDPHVVPDDEEIKGDPVLPISDDNLKSGPIEEPLDKDGNPITVISDNKSRGPIEQPMGQ